MVDQPSADFLTNGPYGRTVYGKGALGFDMIRRAIGDDAFFQGLQDYVAAHRFGIAQPEDLLAALETASVRTSTNSGLIGSSAPRVNRTSRRKTSWRSTANATGPGVGRRNSERRGLDGVFAGEA
ncbi:MAG: M1 family aminopeptidase [Thermomicrobiales bacterium]